MKTEDKTKKHTLIGILIIAGIIVAALSVMEPRVQSIASFCSGWGDGCRNTISYRVLGISLSLWGLGYYGILALVYLFRPPGPWLFYGIMAGCGVEVALVGIMVEMKFFCVLCASNAAVMVLLFLSGCDRQRIPNMLAAGLLFLVIFQHLVDSSGAGSKILSPGSGDPLVLARVGDREITREEVERPLTTQLYKISQAVYKVKNRSLEHKINNILLGQEAGKKGIAVGELKAFIVRDIPPVSRDDVDYFFNSGLARRWGLGKKADPGFGKKAAAHIMDQRKARKIDEFCQTLRSAYPVDVFLEKPTLPLTRVVVEGSPSTGPADAVVTVVEFSDYLCPSCRRGHDTVRRIREKYQGKIQWVFKDHPLDIHPGAETLALAARCANEQGRFWEYQDLLFSGEDPPTPKKAVEYARELGLYLPQFGDCLSNPEAKARLIREVSRDRGAGISATPTLLINGRLRTGVPSFEKLSQMIDQALDEADLSDTGDFF